MEEQSFKKEVLEFLKKQKKGKKKLHDIRVQEEPFYRITFVYNRTSYFVRVHNVQLLGVYCGPFAYDDVAESDWWGDFHENIDIDIKEFELFYRTVVESDEFDFIGRVWTAIDKALDKAEQDCFENHHLLSLLKKAYKFKTNLP